MSGTKTLLAGSVLAAVTVAAAAGCSGGHGSASSGVRTQTAPTTAPKAAAGVSANAGLSGPQLRAAFASAVAAGNAVHVAGTVAQGGSPFSLDLNLDKNGSTEGSVTQSGASVPIKVVGGVTYIQLTPQFLKLEAASDPSITPSVISGIQNKWVSSKSPVGQSLAGGLGALTGYSSFLGTIEETGASASGSPSPSPGASGGGPLDLSTLTPAGTTSYQGGTVAVYKGKDGSTAYFAASGPAYLERVAASGADAGALTFTWNKPVSVAAPPSSDIFTG